MYRTPATLRRWARVFPGKAMPENIADMRPSQNIVLREEDPQLYSLFAGNADPELEASVLDGTFPAEPPTSPREEREAAKRKEAQDIYNRIGNPWMERQVRDEDGTFADIKAPNITEQILIESLDQELAQRLREEAQQDQARREAQAQAAELLGEAQEARQRAEQAEAAAAALSPAG